MPNPEPGVMDDIGAECLLDSVLCGRERTIQASKAIAEALICILSYLRALAVEEPQKSEAIVSLHTRALFTAEGILRAWSRDKGSASVPASRYKRSSPQ